MPAPSEGSSTVEGECNRREFLSRFPTDEVYPIREGYWSRPQWEYREITCILRLILGVAVCDYRWDSGCSSQAS